MAYCKEHEICPADKARNLALTNTFEYNSHNGLMSAQMNTNQYNYHYDTIGNRKEVSANQVLTTYEANRLNQYSHLDGNPLEYDSDGNLLSDGTWQYRWDAENRLMKAILFASSTSQSVDFQYDYMSRLVRRTVWLGTQPERDSAYLYDSWNRIRDISALAGQTVITNQYVWGLDLSGTLQGAGGIGGLLAEITPDGVRYPFCDGNGNITDWVDSRGRPIVHHEYDPYGNEMTGNLPTSFGFSSKPYDHDLGLYYYGYRFYSSEMGRWMNRDPIKERDGIGIYVFTDNTPINAVDILGLKKTKLSKDNQKPKECDKCCKIGDKEGKYTCTWVSTKGTVTGGKEERDGHDKWKDKREPPIRPKPGEEEHDPTHWNPTLCFEIPKCPEDSRSGTQVPLFVDSKGDHMTDEDGNAQGSGAPDHENSDSKKICYELRSRPKWFFSGGMSWKGDHSDKELGIWCVKCAMK